MADNIVIGKLRAILGLDTAQYEAGARKASQSNAALTKEVTKLRAELARVKTDAASARGGLSSLSADIAKAAAGFFTAQAAFSAARQGLRLLTGEFKALTIGGAAVADVAENFQHLTAEAGQVGESLLGTLREGTHQTINDFELMKLVSADLAAGLRLTEAQFATLSQGAFALAQATGGDVKTALDTMNDAMLTGRTRSIALLTGKIDETAAEREFAKSIGVTVDQLSEEGKLESRRIAILKAVGDATERLGEQTDGLDERVQQAQVAWENFNHELGRSIATSPVLNEAMSAIKDELKAAFGTDNAEAVRAITGLVNDFAITLADLSVVGVETARQVTRQWLFWKDGILGVLEAQFRLRASLRDLVGTKQYKEEALVLRALADDLKKQQEEGLQRQLVLEGRFNATAAAIDRIRGRMQVANRAGQAESDTSGVVPTRAATSTARFIDTAGASAERAAAAAARARQDAQERAHRAAIERLREFDVAGEKLMADIAKDYQDRLDVMGQMVEDAERLTKVLDQLTEREQGAQLERVNNATLRSVTRLSDLRQQASIDAREAEFETAEFAIDEAARQGESWKKLYAMERDLRAERLQAAIADSRAQFEAEASVIDQSTTLGLMEFNALEDAHRASVERMVAEWKRGEAQKRADMAVTTGAMAAQFIGATAYALQLFATIDTKSKLLGTLAKAGAISQAIMNTYVGATKALAQGGVFGFATMASVIAAGLAQVAIIKKTPVGYRQGTRDLDFQDFGSRTRTELHGQEAVIPRGGGHRLASEIAMSLRNQFATASAYAGFAAPSVGRPTVFNGGMTGGLRMADHGGGITHIHNAVTIQAWDSSDMQRAVDTQLIPRLNVASQRNTGHYRTEHRKGFGIRPPYGAR